MSSAIAHNLDGLAQWRAAVARHLQQVQQALSDHQLIDDVGVAQLSALRDRLSSDKLVLAFVAEFSRGKSELINAIFFSDAGRRVLPATPGRTTMCPVELRHDLGVAPRLALLPVQTRLQGQTLAEWRRQEDAWQQIPLTPRDPQALAEALAAVTATQRVSVERAVALGFWNESQPEDNPPQDAEGLVEVPAWRHALINYPHPLLERGLVVIDTPGLNAVGAEPELTLGLLPTAHAVVFLLAADTGVTRSDLSLWREHLGGMQQGGANLERYVVLNKIDTLADPLSTPQQVEQQIEQQRLQAAAMLGAPPSRVFALSARDALTARVSGNAAAAAASRVPALEKTLMADLMPRRQELLVQAVVSVVQLLRQSAARQLADQRRQVTEQLTELRGLRGKSGAKLRMMLERVELESVDFERCTSRLAALRAVQMRMLRGVTGLLGSDALRAEVSVMQVAAGSRPLALGARGAFQDLLARMKAMIEDADRHVSEMHKMLEATFLQLNTEYGFSFLVSPMPQMDTFRRELALIEQGYGRHFNLSQAWRMATPGYAEQFRRMLLSKLRVVFENASGEIEMWSRTSTSQIEQQLRERRRGFTRRREALRRVQSAAGELEERIAEVQQQDEHFNRQLRGLDLLCDDAVAAARRGLPGMPGMPVEQAVAVKPAAAAPSAPSAASAAEAPQPPAYLLRTAVPRAVPAPAPAAPPAGLLAGRPPERSSELLAEPAPQPPTGFDTRGVIRPFRREGT